MKERPILFKDEMIQAIQDGRKTQSRRLINWNNIHKQSGCTRGTLGFSDTFNSWAVIDGNGETDIALVDCPYGKVGDQFWVKETHYLWGKWVKNGISEKTGRQKWRFVHISGIDDNVLYNDTFHGDPKPNTYRKFGWYKRPSIFMRREHSRIQLEITNIRVERIQDIHEEEVWEEGIEKGEPYGNDMPGWFPKEQKQPDGWTHSWECAKDCFADLWDSINEKRGFGWDENPWVWAISFKVIK